MLLRRHALAFTISLGLIGGSRDAINISLGLIGRRSRVRLWSWRGGLILSQERGSEPDEGGGAGRVAC